MALCLPHPHRALTAAPAPGTWSTRWTLPRSASRMPRPPSTALPATWWARPWPGTSSAATGPRCSSSEDNGAMGNVGGQGQEGVGAWCPWARLCPAQPASAPGRYGGGSFSFSGLIQSVTRRFSTEFELKEVRPVRVGRGGMAPGPLQPSPAQPWVLGGACAPGVTLAQASLQPGPLGWL